MNRNSFCKIIYIAFLIFALNFTFRQNAGAVDFSDKMPLSFEAFSKDYKNVSKEVELLARIKAVTAADAPELESYLKYIFITDDEFRFLARLIAKSGNEAAYSVLFNLLKDPDFDYSRKYEALSQLAANISSKDFAGAKIIKDFLKEFFKSQECKDSMPLFIKTLHGLSNDSSEEGINYFIEEFKKLPNSYFKSNFLSGLGYMGQKGFDLLKSEYDKAYESNDMEYMQKIAAVISSTGADKAYPFLENELKKFDKNKFGDYYYNILENSIVKLAKPEYLPAIRQYLSSGDEQVISRGVGLLTNYGEFYAEVASAYSKINADTPQKKMFLRIILQSVSGYYNRISSNKKSFAGQIFGLVKDGLTMDKNPAIQKLAFKCLLANIDSDDFRKQAADLAASGNFLAATAFFINGDGSYFSAMLKKDGFLKNSAVYSGVMKENLDLNKIDEKIFKDDPAALKALLGFAAAQRGYVSSNIMSAVLKSKNIAAVKTAIEYSKNCSPEFINYLKSFLKNDEQWLIATNDKEIITYSGYYSDYKYEIFQRYQKKFDEAKNDLRAYLSKINYSDRDELEFASKKMAELLKNSFDGAKKILADENSPFKMRLFLIDSFVKQYDKLKDIIKPDVFNEITGRDDEDAEILSGAFTVLMKINPAETYPKIINVLRQSRPEPRRTMVFLRLLTDYKNYENSKYLIDEYVMKYLKALSQKDDVTEEETAADSADAGVGSNAGKTGGTDETLLSIDELKMLSEQAVYVLDAIGESAEIAASEKIKEFPEAASLLSRVAGQKAGKESFAFYLDSLIKDDKNVEKSVSYLVNYSNLKYKDYLVEKYKQLKPGDIRQEFIISWLLDLSEVPGPLAKFIAKNKPAVLPPVLLNYIMNTYSYSAGFIKNQKKSGKPYVEYIKANWKILNSSAQSYVAGYYRNFNNVNADIDYFFENCFLSSGTESFINEYAGYFPVPLSRIIKKTGDGNLEKAEFKNSFYYFYDAVRIASASLSSQNASKKKEFIDNVSGFLKKCTEYSGSYFKIYKNMNAAEFEFINDNAVKTPERFNEYIDACAGFNYDEKTVKTILGMINSDKLKKELIIKIISLLNKNNHPEIKKAVFEKIKMIFAAKDDKKKTPEKFDYIISSILEVCEEKDYDEINKLASKLYSDNNIDMSSYVQVLNSTGRDFEISAGAFDALGFSEKFNYADSLLNMNVYSIKEMPDSLIYHSGDYDFINAVMGKPDVKKIKALIDESAKKSQNDYYYSGDRIKMLIYLALKTAPENEKMDIISGFIESEADYFKNYVTDYFKIYDDNELVKKIAEKYASQLKKISGYSDLLRLVAANLSADSLRKVIEENEKNNDAYYINESFFDAYVKSADPSKIEFLVKMTDSKNYGYRSYALKALRRLGLKGFEALKSLFEKTADDEKNYYNARNYIEGISEIEAPEAASYLLEIIKSDKKNYDNFRDTAIYELGKTNSSEGLEWLFANVEKHKSSSAIFNALGTFCEKSIFSFIEKEKTAGGKLKIIISSILFRNGVRKPFLNALAGLTSEFAGIKPDFLPAVDYYFFETRRESGTISKKILKTSLKSISAELAGIDFSKTGDDDYEKISVYSYLISFLALSEMPEDIDLLINLLSAKSNRISDSAKYALVKLKGTAVPKVLAAADNPANPPAAQRAIIYILAELKVKDAGPVFLKALKSKDREVSGEACRAIGRLKIVKAIPALIEMLDSKDNSYYIVSALSEMIDDSFDEVCGALMIENKSKAAYQILSNSLRKDIMEKIVKKFEEVYKNNKKAGLMLAAILSNNGSIKELSRLLDYDQDALIYIDRDIYISDDAFKKIGKIALSPAVNLLIKSKSNEEKYRALSIITALDDPEAAPPLAKYMKQCQDHYLKNRILELLAKISKDKLSVFFIALVNESNYNIKMLAATGIESLAQTSPEAVGPEIFKLLALEKDNSFLAIYIRILGNIKYKEASGEFIKNLKNSSSDIVLAAASEAIFKLDQLEIIRDSVKSILLESKNECNSAYAARVFRYYEDSKSVEVLNNELLKSLEGSQVFKKIEIIKALSVIADPSSLKPLSKCTSSNFSDEREAAKIAIQKISPAGAERYIAPDPPGNFTAMPADKACNLSWNVPLNKPSSHYILYKNGKKMEELKITSTSHEDKGLKNGEKQSYAVFACDNYGNVSASSQSAEAIPSKPPGPVENLQLMAGETYVKLTWGYSAPQKEESLLKEFIIYRNGKKIASLTPETTEYADYALSAGKTYSYKVVGVSALGVPGEQAAVSGTPEF